MEGWKENIQGLDISEPLYQVLNKQISKLDINRASEVKVEYGNGSYGDFVFISLKGAGSIPMNCCVTRYYVDLSVGKNDTPIFEMQKIIKPSRFNKYERIVSAFFGSDITEIEYSSGRVDFINRTSGKMIFSERRMFSLNKGAVVEKREYCSWI